MKKLNEAAILSTGNATSLMVFIDIAYYIKNQKGMLSLAFPNIGNRDLYKMTRGFANNPAYSENQEQLIGISERFYNNSSLKGLYKTLAVLASKETTPSESAARMQDLNLVLSKIERFITGKLTNEERELFSSMEDSIDNYSDSLNSNLNSSIESTTKEEPEETPAEEPVEEPAEEPKEEKPEETPAEQPETTEEEPEEKTTVAQPKEKTEEQFRSLIKKLVRESIRQQRRK